MDIIKHMSRRRRARATVLFRGDIEECRCRSLDLLLSMYRSMFVDVQIHLSMYRSMFVDVQIGLRRGDDCGSSKPAVQYVYTILNSARKPRRLDICLNRLDLPPRCCVPSSPAAPRNSALSPEPLRLLPACAGRFQRSEGLAECKRMLFAPAPAHRRLWLSRQVPSPIRTGSDL